MKAITADNYIVRPFITHKTQTYTYTFLGGGNPDQVSIDLAVVPPTGSTWVWDGESEPVNPSGIPQHTLYESVQHMFYSTSSSFQPTGSQFYVVNLAQSSYGEGIDKGSFTMVGNNSIVKLYDDGKGNIVSTEATSSIVGNIFYAMGVAVIQQASPAVSGAITSHEGLLLDTGSVVTIGFDATHTIYEHSIICTIEGGEFNYSSNPSIKGTALDGIDVIDQMAVEQLVPYMTMIGLYNDAGDLMAIAKFPRPIKRAINSQQSVIVRFDV